MIKTPNVLKTQISSVGHAWHSTIQNLNNYDVFITLQYNYTIANMCLVCVFLDFVKDLVVYYIHEPKPHPALPSRVSWSCEPQPSPALPPVCWPNKIEIIVAI